MKDSIDTVYLSYVMWWYLAWLLIREALLPRTELLRVERAPGYGHLVWSCLSPCWLLGLTHPSLNWDHWTAKGLWYSKESEGVLDKGAQKRRPALWRDSLLRWAEGKAPEGACDFRLGDWGLCMSTSRWRSSLHEGIYESMRWWLLLKNFG